MAKHKPTHQYFLLAGILLLAIAAASGLVWGRAAASADTSPPRQGSPLHPAIPLLDENGNHVLDSGKPLSTMQTCGDCHDTAFITNHSYHVSAGLDEVAAPGSTHAGRPWDISAGYFGSWNSIEYRYLSPQGDGLVDLTTPAWIQLYGLRHVGGGPLEFSRTGDRLEDLEYSPDSLETNILNPATGELEPWDWDKSGTIEMNCFLCHIPNPNNQTRREFLQDGQFAWVNTATLDGTGIVVRSDDGLDWNREAFDAQRELAPDLIQIQDPTDLNCGLCHGLVHDDVEDPLVTLGCAPERWSTITTGQIISPQKMADSGMNLASKSDLARSWDVHAERLLNCVDCHYSLNNPLFYRESDITRPEGLLYDPRRIEIGEYLEKPLHQFARGNSAQNQAAPQFDYTMRTCESCHAVRSTHTWLPYLDSHLEALSCESCHIPRLFSSANMLHDWTVLQEDGQPRKECRGTEGDAGSMETLITGYQPVLIPGPDRDGTLKLAPHNLITTWFWIYGDPPRPVRQMDLSAAYFENGGYHPGILLRFDENQDGRIDSEELQINNQSKYDFVRDRLMLLGLANPRISAETIPFSISHDVASADWALDDCTACHGDQSLVTQPIKLASSIPGGVLPEFVAGTGRTLEGELLVNDAGELYYDPTRSASGFYLFGHSRLAWLDWLGLALNGLVFAGVALHGGLRLYLSSRNKTAHRATRKVYMYGGYERMWHWLQTIAIVMLLVTGLVIHRPDSFGFLNFRNMVAIHNILAAILAVNAGLSLFYHLATGEIRQYIPRPRGFFDRTISQAKFYLGGIFRGEEHPFEKTPEKKLNPLQQITYIGLLNVLLPLQGITGALMWGLQRWPEAAARLGGLPVLAPVHTLIAWLFGAFIIMHVYLTTTGHTAVSSLEAMITGWEDVEDGTD